MDQFNNQREREAQNQGSQPAVFVGGVRSRWGGEFNDDILRMVNAQSQEEAIEAMQDLLEEWTWRANAGRNNDEIDFNKEYGGLIEAIKESYSQYKYFHSTKIKELFHRLMNELGMKIPGQQNQNNIDEAAETRENQIEKWIAEFITRINVAKYKGTLMEYKIQIPPSHDLFREAHEQKFEIGGIMGEVQENLKSIARSLASLSVLPGGTSSCNPDNPDTQDIGQALWKALQEKLELLDSASQDGRNPSDNSKEEAIPIYRNLPPLGFPSILMDGNQDAQPPLYSVRDAARFLDVKVDDLIELWPKIKMRFSLSPPPPVREFLADQPPADYLEKFNERRKFMDYWLIHEDRLLELRNEWNEKRNSQESPSNTESSTPQRGKIGYFAGGGMPGYSDGEIADIFRKSLDKDERRKLDGKIDRYLKRLAKENPMELPSNEVAGQRVLEVIRRNYEQQQIDQVMREHMKEQEIQVLPTLSPQSGKRKKSSNQVTFFDIDKVLNSMKTDLASCTKGTEEYSNLEKQILEREKYLYSQALSEFAGAYETIVDASMMSGRESYKPMSYSPEFLWEFGHGKYKKTIDESIVEGIRGNSKRFDFILEVLEDNLKRSGIKSDKTGNWILDSRMAGEDGGHTGLMGYDPIKVSCAAMVIETVFEGHDKFGVIESSDQKFRREDKARKEVARKILAEEMTKKVVVRVLHSISEGLMKLEENDINEN